MNPSAAIKYMGPANQEVCPYFKGPTFNAGLVGGCRVDCRPCDVMHQVDHFLGFHGVIPASTDGVLLCGKQPSLLPILSAADRREIREDPAKKAIFKRFFPRLARKELLHHYHQLNRDQVNGILSDLLPLLTATKIVKTFSSIVQGTFDELLGEIHNSSLFEKRSEPIPRSKTIFQRVRDRINLHIPKTTLHF